MGMGEKRDGREERGEDGRRREGGRKGGGGGRREEKGEGEERMIVTDTSQHMVQGKDVYIPVLLHCVSDNVGKVLTEQSVGERRFVITSHHSIALWSPLPSCQTHHNHPTLSFPTSYPPTVTQSPIPPKCITPSLSPLSLPPPPPHSPPPPLPPHSLSLLTLSTHCDPVSPYTRCISVHTLAISALSSFMAALLYFTPGNTSDSKLCSNGMSSATSLGTIVSQTLWIKIYTKERQE